MKRQIPWTMVLFRVVLCPVVFFGTRVGWNGLRLSLIVLFALVSDIFDGILARRWNCETTALRRVDSWADTIFYVGVAASLWIRENSLLRSVAPLLFILAMLEGSRYGFDWWKFGRAASYHSYLAKAWGLVMGIAVIGILTFSRLRWLLVASVLIGIVANVEGLLMSLVLPRWQNDVKTLASAVRYRRQMLKGKSEVDLRQT